MPRRSRTPGSTRSVTCWPTRSSRTAGPRSDHRPARSGPCPRRSAPVRSAPVRPARARPAQAGRRPSFGPDSGGRRAHRGHPGRTRVHRGRGDGAARHRDGVNHPKPRFVTLVREFRFRPAGQPADRYSPRSDGVPGRLGDVLPPRRGGPPDLAGGKLLGVPARVLLEPGGHGGTSGCRCTGRSGRPLRTGCCARNPSSSRAPAARPGARGVPDLGQVPEQDPGIVALGLVPVITLAGGDRLEGDEQVPLAGGSGGQSPGAVPAGRAGLVRRR